MMQDYQTMSKKTAVEAERENLLSNRDRHGKINR